jgi:hypothetical protein
MTSIGIAMNHKSMRNSQDSQYNVYIELLLIRFQTWTSFAHVEVAGFTNLFVSYDMCSRFFLYFWNNISVIALSLLRKE